MDNYTKTLNEKIKTEGWKKIGQEGGTYIIATFWREDTDETISTCVRDYDYADCSRDNNELYYMDIDTEAWDRYARKHMNGIFKGDIVEIYKGRKSLGTRGKVVDKYQYRDRYGRFVAMYLVLDNGIRVQQQNCKVVEERK